MKFTKPKETLPALRESMLPAVRNQLVPLERSVVYAKLIAVIPHKVSDNLSVDRECLGLSLIHI